MDAIDRIIFVAFNALRTKVIWQNGTSLFYHIRQVVPRRKVARGRCIRDHHFRGTGCGRRSAMVSFERMVVSYRLSIVTIAQSLTSRNLPSNVFGAQINRCGSLWSKIWGGRGRPM